MPSPHGVRGIVPAACARGERTLERRFHFRCIRLRRPKRNFPCHAMDVGLANIDTTTPMGRLLFQVTGAFAEFERSMIRQRVQVGLNSIKAKIAKDGNFTTKAGIIRRRLCREDRAARPALPSPRTVHASRALGGAPPPRRDAGERRRPRGCQVGTGEAQIGG